MCDLYPPQHKLGLNEPARQLPAGDALKEAQRGLPGLPFLILGSLDTHPKPSGIELPFDAAEYVHQAHLLYSDVHGSAMRFAAEQRDLAESIAELHQLADGRDEALAEAAGITAGSWVAWPSTHMGYELVAARMLIMAAP